MSFPWLFLWLNVYPGAAVSGVVVAFVAYWIAHPRASQRCLGVLTEVWRAYAFVAAVAGFALGAQLHLWLTFGWRAPLALTHLGTVLGVMIITLAPTPVILASCNDGDRDRRALAAACLLAAVGAAFVVGDVAMFRGAWNRLAAAAAHQPQALYDVGMLKGLRYVEADPAIRVIDESRPNVVGLVDLVDAARAGDTTLDLTLRNHVAGRIVAESTVHQPNEAASAVWWLTDRGDDLARAYGRAHPDAAVPAEGGILALEAAVIHLVRTAADRGGSAQADTQPFDPIARDLLTALDREVGRLPLAEETEQAVATIVDYRPRVVVEQPGAGGDSPSLSDLAVRILFRNGSRSSLRVVLPRFRDTDDPAWALLITDCPRSSRELIGLIGDADPAVAEGAALVLSWVRRYCVSSAPVTG